MQTPWASLDKIMDHEQVRLGIMFVESVEMEEQLILNHVLTGNTV